MGGIDRSIFLFDVKGEKDAKNMRSLLLFLCQIFHMCTSPFILLSYTAIVENRKYEKASLSEVWLNSPKGWTFCNLWIPISFLSCFKVKLWWFRAWAWLIQSCASGGRSCQTFIILSSSARLQQQPEEYLGSECLLPESEICILCPRVFREAAELVTIFRYQNIPPQPQWLQHLDSDISQHISAWIQTLSLSHKMGNGKCKRQKSKW